MNDNINKTVNEILESYSKHEQTCRLSEDNIINKSVLIQVLEEIRKLLFPGYFDKNRVREEYIGYIVGDRIEFIQYNLKKQIAMGGCSVYGHSFHETIWNCIFSFSSTGLNVGNSGVQIFIIVKVKSTDRIINVLLFVFK